MSDTINEIWSLYADEGQLALDLAEESLIELKANPTNTEAIGGLFRGMHTFKGNSRLLGLDIVEARAHLAEDLIGLVRDEGVPLDADLLALLHEALDAMRGMLEETLANHRDMAESSSFDLTERMREAFAQLRLGVIPDSSAGIQAATPTLPEPTTAAESVCAPETVPAEARTADDDAPLAGDAIYLQIFRDMVADVTADLRATLARFDDGQTAAREEMRDGADRLLYAALQIGLKHWLDMLSPLAGPASLSRAEAAALIDAVVAAGERELGLPAATAAPEPQDIAVELGAGTQDVASRSMLEAIGEIITGHALARHMLRSLAHADPMQVIEAELHAADGDWKMAREGVRHRLRDWRDRVEQLLQVDTQLGERLDRLQETAVSVRSRPASLLLKPIAVFANTLAASSQRRLFLTTSGGDIELDFGILDALKAPLHALVTFAITTSIETGAARLAAGKPESGRLEIAVTRSEDHVTITVEDDGRGPDLAHIRTRARQLGWTEDVSANMMLRDDFAGNDGDGVNLADLRRNLLLQGGDLSVSVAQGGGTRFQIVLPLAMVVIDGMVVRTGEVVYVVPIGGIQRIVQSAENAIIRVSAGGRSHLLRLDNGDLVPVRCLRGNSEHRGRLPDAGSPDTACAGIARSAGIETTAAKFLFLIAGTDDNRIAVPVDELIGQQLVLVRPLQGYLSGIQGVTGCALLGGGGVGMVLDMGFVLDLGKAA